MSASVLLCSLIVSAIRVAISSIFKLILAISCEFSVRICTDSLSDLLESLKRATSLFRDRHSKVSHYCTTEWYLYGSMSKHGHALLAYSL